MHSVTHHLLSDLRWTMAPVALLVFVVVRSWLRMRRHPQRRSLADALISFQASIAGMAALVVLVMFSFQTPVLSTFGVPRDETAVTEPRQLFHLMKMYNRELVSASEAVQSLALFGMIVLATAANLASAVAEGQAARTGGTHSEGVSDAMQRREGA